mmetsp:Transcript_18134/g.24891  ORF Transcript_18134/g.24891 Transcript_18134/m.24891 type:complete len:131 (+) Transcript_18134:622-1014(+)
MKSEFRVVIDKDLHRILAELPADRSDLLVESGGIHHHLLLMRSCFEDCLDVTSHAHFSLFVRIVTIYLLFSLKVFHENCYRKDEKFLSLKFSITSILSHSSSTKCLTCERSNTFRVVAKSITRPGVPTTM